MFRKYWRNLLGLLALLALSVADVTWISSLFNRDLGPGWIETIVMVVSPEALLVVLMLVGYEPLHDFLDLRHGFVDFRDNLDQRIRSFNEAIIELHKDRNQNSLKAQMELEALVEVLQTRPGLLWYRKNCQITAKALFGIIEHLKKAGRTDEIWQAKHLIRGPFRDFVMSMPLNRKSREWLRQGMVDSVE